MRARHSHHEILGVPRSADSDDIRAAYRRLLRTCHPDLGGSPALFDLVNEAYTALIAATQPLPDPHGVDPCATDTGERGATVALSGRRRPPTSRPTTGAPPAVGTARVPAADYASLRRSRSPLWRPQPATAYQTEPVAAPQLVRLYL